MFVIVGYVLVIACVFGAYALTGVNFAVLAHAAPHEMIVIAGAATGAFLVGNSNKTISATVKALPKIFQGSKYTKARYMALMALLYDILTKVRKEGMMAVESDIDSPAKS